MNLAHIGGSGVLVCTLDNVGNRCIVGRNGRREQHVHPVEIFRAQSSPRHSRLLSATRRHSPRTPEPGGTPGGPRQGTSDSRWKTIGSACAVKYASHSEGDRRPQSRRNTDLILAAVPQSSIRTEDVRAAGRAASSEDAKRRVFPVVHTSREVSHAREFGERSPEVVLRRVCFLCLAGDTAR